MRESGKTDIGVLKLSTNTHESPSNSHLLEWPQLIFCKAKAVPCRARSATEAVSKGSKAASHELRILLTLVYLRKSCLHWHRAKLKRTFWHQLVWKYVSGITNVESAEDDQESDMSLFSTNNSGIQIAPAPKKPTFRGFSWDPWHLTLALGAWGRQQQVLASAVVFTATAVTAALQVHRRGGFMASTSQYNSHDSKMGPSKKQELKHLCEVANWVGRESPRQTPQEPSVRRAESSGK